jgi:hypothetical protein
MTLGRNDAGEAMCAPYGPKPMGIVTFNSEGRMIAVLCDGRTDLPAEHEREFNAYAGNFSFDGCTLLTRVDVASDIRSLGGNQTRRVRFDGNRLVMCPPPRTWKGIIQHRELFWERIAP